MAVQIQLRNDIAANWTASNPVLAVGELGLESDTSSYKIGDGTNPWNNLPYGGVDGASAYGIAVANGFVGTEQQWLDSLVGADGVGVPPGGDPGQVLSKVDGQDYNTQWVDQSGGGGSGETITHGVFNGTQADNIAAFSLVLWVEGAGNGEQSGVRPFPTDGSGWGVQPEEIAGITINAIPVQAGGEIVIAGALQVDGSPYNQSGYVYVNPQDGTLSNSNNASGGNAWNRPIGWVTIGQEGAKLIFRPWAMSRQINSLTDVKVNNPQAGDTLVYNDQNGSWENGSGGGGGTSIGDNLFLNGGFDIWQKWNPATNPNAEFTFGGTERYADMWTFFQEGGTGDRLIAKMDLGTELGNDTLTSNYVRFVSSPDTIGNVKLNQKIEDVRTAQNQDVVISFWAKSNVSVNVSGQFRQYFGSGTTSGDVYFGTQNGDQIQANSGWKFIQLNAFVQNVSGKDIKPGSFLAPEIVFQNPGNNAEVSVAQVKMEIGTTSTKFVRKHSSVDEELRGCQRYLYRWNATSIRKAVPAMVTVVENSGSTLIDSTIVLPSRMRATPSFTWSGDVNHFDYYGMGFSIVLFSNGWISINSDNEIVTLRNTKNIGTTFGSEVIGLKLASDSQLVDAWLEFNAEFTN